MAAKNLKIRLSVMMFLQYVVMGATWPIMSLYLQDHLRFSGKQTGVVLSMAAVAAFVSPIVGACVADRLICAERLLSLCHFGAAGLMAAICLQTEFVPMALLFLVYKLVMGPTVPLTNAITFHNHPEGNQQFGNVRVWGTLGWIAVGWGFSFLWLRGSGTDTMASRLPDALKLSALASLLLGLYALILPKPKHPQEGSVCLFPGESLKVLRQPKILIISVISLLIGIVDRYYYLGMGPFLSHRGFSDAAIMPVMSLGQISEVLVMFTLAGLLARLGFKRMMILGILAEILRFVVFALGFPRLLLIATIPCHGIAYALYFTVVYIYLDSHCDKRSRTGLHQLFAILTSGIGVMCANLLGGECLDRFVINTTAPSFFSFWMVPTALSVSGLAILVIAFHTDQVIKHKS